MLGDLATALDDAVMESRKPT